MQWNSCICSSALQSQSPSPALRREYKTGWKRPSFLNCTSSVCHNTPYAPHHAHTFNRNNKNVSKDGEMKCSLPKVAFPSVTIRSICQNDWFLSIDLKDDYFHEIFILHTGHFSDSLIRAYATSSQSFSSVCPKPSCVKVGLAPLRLSGHKILTYMDDWLGVSPSQNQVSQDTQCVLTHVAALCFINLAKSNLTLSQNVIFLGLQLSSVTMRARLSAERIQSFTGCLSRFTLGAKKRYQMCLWIQGLMAAAISMLPLGLIRMTDGWVATQEGRTVNGKWPIQLHSVYINYLELHTVWKALGHFLPACGDVMS